MIYILHIHLASKAEIVWLRAPANLDSFWAFQLSAQSTHKNVMVVEDTAAIANTTQHRPFLCTQAVSYSTCANLAQKSQFSWC